MSKLENDSVRFTKEMFICMLFPLLRKNRVTKVNKKELEKKLYYYSLKEEYKELFQDVVSINQNLSGDKMIDIEGGLLNFKTMDGNVIWDDMHPEVLLITKSYSDLSWCIEYLSIDGILKFQKLGLEFGIRNCVESLDIPSFQIYPKDANGLYHLGQGSSFDKIYSWELITDGEIEQIEKENNCSEDLDFSNLEVSFENVNSFAAKIKNASFVLMQEFENEILIRTKAYTDLLDLKTLKQIRGIKREDCVCITNEAPFVRKYTLK